MTLPHSLLLLLDPKLDIEPYYPCVLQTNDIVT